MRRIKHRTIEIIVKLSKWIKISGFSVYEIILEDVVSKLKTKEDEK